MLYYFKYRTVTNPSWEEPITLDDNNFWNAGGFSSQDEWLTVETQTTIREVTIANNMVVKFQNWHRIYQDSAYGFFYWPSYDKTYDSTGSYALPIAWVEGLNVNTTYRYRIYNYFSGANGWNKPHGGPPHYWTHYFSLKVNNVSVARRSSRYMTDTPLEGVNGTPQHILQNNDKGVSYESTTRPMADGRILFEFDSIKNPNATTEHGNGVGFSWLQLFPVEDEWVCKDVLKAPVPDISAENKWPNRLTFDITKNLLFAGDNSNSQSVQIYKNKIPDSEPIQYEWTPVRYIPPGLNGGVGPLAGCISSPVTITVSSEYIGPGNSVYKYTTSDSNGDGGLFGTISAIRGSTLTISVVGDYAELVTHPIKITEFNDQGQHGTPRTDVVRTDTGGQNNDGTYTLSWVVPYDTTVDKYQYQCETHSHMRGTIVVSSYNTTEILPVAFAIRSFG